MLEAYGFSFQDAIFAANTLADNAGEQLLTPAHMLLGILSNRDPVVMGSVAQMVPNVDNLSKSLNSALGSGVIVEESRAQRLENAIIDLFHSVSHEQRCDRPAMFKLFNEILERCPLPSLSEDARRVWKLAHQEAARAGARQTEAEHLLLGLLADADNEPARALNAVGITLDLARSAVGESSRLDRHPLPGLSRRLEPSVTHVFSEARKSARRSGRAIITLKDLLLALVDDDELGLSLSMSLKVDLQPVRRRIEKMPASLVSPPTCERSPGASSDHSFNVGTGRGEPCPCEKWMDPRSHDALLLAGKEATRLNRIMVGHADLLAGLVAASGEELLGALRQAGLDLSRAHELIAAAEERGP